VGKGDRKTRRGKIYRGSFGKSRPKDPAKGKKKTSPAPKSGTAAGRK
jgi:30S ribosomal protein S31